MSRHKQKQKSTRRGVFRSTANISIEIPIIVGCQHNYDDYGFRNHHFNQDVDLSQFHQNEVVGKLYPTEETRSQRKFSNLFKHLGEHNVPLQISSHPKEGYSHLEEYEAHFTEFRMDLEPDRDAPGLGQAPLRMDSFHLKWQLLKPERSGSKELTGRPEFYCHNPIFNSDS